MADEIVTVRLEDIYLDPRFQVRTETDGGTVRRYADALRAGQQLPAVHLGIVEGVLVCLSGFHRIAAHRRLGWSTIEATVEEITVEAARLTAALANLGNGLPIRKRKEKRRVFRLYVLSKDHRHPSGTWKSARAMSRDLHGLVTHKTIDTWMKADFPGDWKQMHRANDDDGNAPGGLPEGSGADSDDMHLERGRAHLNDARNNARGIIDPEKRGEFLEDLRRLMETVRADGPWRAPDPWEDF